MARWYLVIIIVGAIVGLMVPSGEKPRIVAVTTSTSPQAGESHILDRFGASAPGAVALDRLGINLDNVVTTARAMVALAH